MARHGLRHRPARRLPLTRRGPKPYIPTTRSVASSQRHAGAWPSRCTPPTQRSSPASSAQSASPASTRSPSGVSDRQVSPSVRAAARSISGRGPEGEPVGDEEAGEVAEERPRLVGADVDEHVLGRVGPGGQGGEHPPLGQAEPVARGGVLASDPVEGLAHEAQRGRDRRGQRRQPGRRGRAEGVPRLLGQRERLVADRLALVEQALELVAVELPEADEARHVRMLADAHELHVRSASAPRGTRRRGSARAGAGRRDRPRTRAAAALVGGQRRVAVGLVAHDRVLVGPPRAGDERRSHPAQARGVDGGHRPVVQDVAPGQDPAVDPRRPQTRDRRVAVGDVQGARLERGGRGGIGGHGYGPTRHR